jgi:hypothetical protein
MWATKFHTHTKKGKIIDLYILIFKFTYNQQKLPDLTTHHSVTKWTCTSFRNIKSNHVTFGTQNILQNVILPQLKEAKILC